MLRFTSRHPAGAAALVAALLGGSCVPPTRNEPPAGPFERRIEIDLPATGNPNFGNIRSQWTERDLGPLHSHERVASCPAPGGCVPATLEIQSIGKTIDIEVDKPLSRPRVIGIVKNTDPSRQDAYYHLEPKSTYLIWVEAAPPGGPVRTKNQWGFFRLYTPTGAAEKRMIGAVKKCHDYKHGLFDRSDTDFRDCAREHTAIPPKKPNGVLDKASAVVTSLLEWISGSQPTLQSNADDWFECGSGCCTGATTMS